MKNSLVLVLVAGSIGFGLGYVARGPGAIAPEPAARGSEPLRADAPTAPSPPTPRATATVASAPRPPPAPPIPIAPPTDAPVLVRENTLLREQLGALRAQVEATRIDAESATGKPLTAPEGLAPRFSENALRQAVSSALEEAGLGGSVSSIDCTEYPCIVYGEGKGDPEVFARLKATNAMRPYVDDSSNSFGWGVGDGTPDRPRRDYLGLALYPRDDSRSRGDEIRKRLKFRSSEMAATFDRP